ncbi:MAG: hypothetical protein E7Y34_00700 [Mycoplasma sp.]|nr:hypothetical protein [Mycoplasma sp.]
MFTFFIGISILIIGSLTYGRFVNKLIKPNPNKPTPAYYSYDKSDYAPVGDFKSKMILALGIIGAGPVFGPIMAAIWGPIILLLIPIGNIIGGAIHDYFVGFASLKNNGKQLSWMGTKFLGIKLGKVVLFFIVFLLLLVSSVFVYMPLDVLPFMKNAKWWWVFIGIVIIFSYYFLSIILPINKFMAKIYPIIGIAFMTFAIVFLITLFINNGSDLWSKGLSGGGWFKISSWNMA